MAASPTFDALWLQTNDPVGLSLLFLMAWVSASDGSVSEDETAEMSRIIGTGPLQAHIPLLVEMARRGDLPALEAASRIVQDKVPPDRRRLFLQLVIQIALADGVVRTTESHVLRFVCDLLGLPAGELSAVFQELTGKPFPSPGDPSRAVWWSRTEPAIRRQPDASLARLRALAALGLGEEATLVEIRSAYRRLAAVHHPDRFAALGEAAVRAATESFRRITDAYERLTANA